MVSKPVKKWALAIATALALLVAPQAAYHLSKEPPSVKTAVDVFSCDLANRSGTLALKEPCTGRHVSVAAFVANKTYLKYEVRGRLEAEATAQDVWAGMTTVGEVISGELRTYTIGNRTYRKTPELLVPPPFRAALANLSVKHPWLHNAYVVNGAVFRGEVYEPAVGQKVVALIFSTLQPICGESWDTWIDGRPLNKRQSCRFTALLLVNKTRLVVFDVRVELTNIDDALEIQEKEGEVRIRGGAVGRLMEAVNNATRLLEKAIK